RRKPGNRGAHLLTPAINLPRRNIHPASDLGNDGSRREALRDNYPLLVVAPAPATLNPGDHLYSRHPPSLAPVQTLSFAPVLSPLTTSPQGGLHRAGTISSPFPAAVPRRRGRPPKLQ